MATSVMMNWGGIKFSQLTRSYKKLDRTTAYRWAKVDRLGRMPAQQFVGEGEQTITLSGVVFGLYNNVGTRQLDELYTAAEAGKPALLQDGRGVVYGKFVLTNITEAHEKVMDTGAPRKQTYTLTFKRYGGDS